MREALPREGGPERDGPGGGGPGGPPPMRGFATGYRKHSGDMMVYGGGVLTLVGVLATVVNVQPAFMIASLAGTFSAFYFWPTLDTRRPQLGADPRGIYVARVGLIRWDAVAGLRVERKALRTMRLATLEIRLSRPLAEALEAADRPPLVERLSARNEKVSGETIRVTLHSLEMPDDEIEARLAALSRRSG